MNLTVPSGPNTATVQVLDQNGADVSGSCTITATSSDPTIIQIGNPDATTPNVIPFVSLQPGGTATISYNATNDAGTLDQSDDLTVQVTAPASMLVTYGAVVPIRGGGLKKN